MTKKEALKILNKKMVEGYITHTVLLDIYEDNDDIPEYVVRMACYKPLEIKPIIVCSPQFAERLQMAFIHMRLCDELLENPHKQ
jgi:hypothetical protein